MKTRILFCAGLLTAAVACGDDDDDTVPTIDSGTPDAGEPDGGTPDAGSPDAGTPDAGPFVAPEVHVLPLFPTTPDQLQSAVAGPGGTFYIAGFSASALTGGTRFVYLAKATATGVDTTFGEGGLAITPLDFKGGTGEIDLVVQSDGKVIVSATVANAVQPLDTDVALARYTSEGDLDTTFGDQGVRILNLNTGTLGTTEPISVSGGDRSRAIAVDAEDRIYHHGLQLGVGEGRTDTDFVVSRLTANGAVDESFGEAGKFILDVKGTGDVRSNATPHAVRVLPDGNILAGGYASTAGVGNGMNPQPVIYKLDVNGDKVLGFAVDGVYHQAPLTIQTEVYGFALHDGYIVTGGYGRDTGMQNDWVSLKLDVATGILDETWGGTTNGVVVFDPKNTNDPNFPKDGDNCRGAFALPGGKTLLIGSAGPGNMVVQDATFAILDEEGQLDTAYGTGVHTLDVGGNDQFWGAAVSGNSVLLVGFKGGGPAAMQTATMNDNGTYAIFSLR